MQGIRNKLCHTNNLVLLRINTLHRNQYSKQQNHDSDSDLEEEILPSIGEQFREEIKYLADRIIEYPQTIEKQEIIPLKMGGIRKHKESYNLLLFYLFKSKKFNTDLVPKILKEMEKSNITDPNHRTYRLVINGYFNKNEQAKALKLYNELQTKKIPSLFTVIAAVITKLCETNQIALALSFYSRLKKMNMTGTLKLYTSIIIALLKINKIERAQELFHEMKENQIKPDVELYTSFIYYLPKHKKRIYFNLFLEEKDLQPNTRIILIMLKVALESKNQVEITQLIDYAESHNVNSALIFNAIINERCKSGKYSTVEALIETMKSKNIELSSDTFNPIINSLVNDKKLVEALGIFQSLKNYNVVPCIFTFNIIIKGLCFHKKYSDVFHLIEQLQNEYRLSPNNVTFNTIIQAYCRDEDYDAAINTLNVMKKILIPDFNPYLSIIRAINLDKSLCDDDRVLLLLEAMKLEKIFITKQAHTFIKDSFQDKTSENYKKKAMQLLNSLPIKNQFAKKLLRNNTQKYNKSNLLSS